MERYTGIYHEAFLTSMDIISCDRLRFFGTFAAAYLKLVLENDVVVTIPQH